MRVWPFALTLCLACGGSDSSPQKPDAGSSEDAGTPEPDAGNPEPDAGTPEPDAGSDACSFVKSGVAAGRIQEPELDEASGLAASRRYPDVLWSHNDSGDEARIFALKTDGDALGILAVDGADFLDWEDIAAGPGPDEKAYLYIADIGDNNEERAKVQLYRVAEPERAQDGSFGVTSVTAHRVDVTYEDKPHDAETLLMDPLTGDAYIVTKGALLGFDAQVPVFRVAAADLLGSTATATRVGTVPMGPASGGDVSPDGLGIVIRNYLSVRWFSRQAGEPFAMAFERAPCDLPLNEPLGEQGEAVGFAADGSGYYTTAEGKKAVLRFYGLR